MSKRSLPTTRSQNFLDKVKELLEYREGVRGGKDNAFVTFADLNKVDPLKGQGAGPVVIQGDPPSPPKNLSVTPGKLGNALSWDKSSSDDVWYYQVWVSNTQDRSDAEHLANVSHPNTTYTHTLGASDVTDDHYYWVRAISWSGLYSTWEPSEDQGGILVEGQQSYDEMTTEMLGVLQDKIIELDDDHFVKNQYGVHDETFYIALPGDEGNWKPVFVAGDIDGKPTIGIDGQLVVDGSIFANSIGADQIKATHLDANEAFVNTIQSSDFEAGSTGWKIDHKNNTAEFNDIKIVVGPGSDVDYGYVSGSKPPSNADNTNDNPQNYSWISGSKPPIDADNTQYQLDSGAAIDNAKANGYTLIDGGYINTSVLSVDYAIIGGSKPPSDADNTNDNPQNYSWISGSKPPTNADNTTTVIDGGVITTGYIRDSNSKIVIDLGNQEIDINTPWGLKVAGDGGIGFVASDGEQKGIIIPARDTYGIEIEPYIGSTSFRGIAITPVAVYTRDIRPIGAYVGSDLSSDIGTDNDPFDTLYIENVRTDWLRRRSNPYIACVGDFRPSSDDKYDLGSSSYYWADIYHNDSYSGQASYMLDQDCISIIESLAPATDEKGKAKKNKKGNKKLKWRSMPEQATNKWALYNELKKDNGDLINKEDFEEMWDNDEFDEWRSFRDTDVMLDVLVGAVYQLSQKIKGK